MSPDAPTSETSVSETWTHRLQLGGIKTFRALCHLVQAPVDQLTKKLFLAAYEASDDAYWRHHENQCEWRSLNGLIEYTPDLLTVPGERAAPTYLIAIRGSANNYLERVAIKIKAKKSGVIHQQEITLSQLCETPVCTALTAIPLKPRSSKDGGWQKLGDLYIQLAEAVDCDGIDLVQRNKIADIFPSTGMDVVSHGHVERWGRYWNIDEINVEKENIKTLCYRDLVQSARKLGRPLTIRRTAYRLLTSHLGLAATFWCQNLWKAEGIRASVAQVKANQQPIRSEKNRAVSDSPSTAHPEASIEVGS